MHTKRLSLLLALPLLWTALACSKHAAQAPVPGSASNFDSQSYLTLVAADSVIETTRNDLNADKFPASIAPDIKTALNTLITVYNVADASYLTYHAAAMTNTATAAQAADLSQKLNTLSAAQTNLTAVKGRN